MPHVKLLTTDPLQPHPIDDLLNYLFTDKRSVYVDDVVINADGSFEVSWCLDYTLYLGEPQWMDTHLERDDLLLFIKKERLNYWESFRYDHLSGAIQPFTNTCADLETFLDENFREIIAEYMIHILPGDARRLAITNAMQPRQSSDDKPKIETLTKYDL